MPVVYLPPAPVRNGPFPDGPLGLDVELLVGNWTSIKSRVAQPITITRGRSDGQQSASPSSLPMQWMNDDGMFSPRNPTGPYYGQLSRNTPVRVSIPAQHNYLRIQTDDGSYCFTPSTAGLAQSADLTIQIDLELYDWTPSVLVAKYADSSTGRSWALTLEADGTAKLSWWPDSLTQYAIQTSVPLPLGRFALQAALTLSTGTVVWQFASSLTSGDWATFGIAETFGTSTSLYVSSQQVSIAGNTGLQQHGYNSAQGRIYGVNIYLGGTLEASPDFTSSIAGAATLTDAQRNIWSLSGTAEYSDRDYRFCGECASLPQSWSVNSVYTTVTASGPMRRINQNNYPLDSPLKRALVRDSNAPAAYWPCEDGSTSQSIAAAIGGRSMEVDGAPTYSSFSGFVCSMPLPVLNGSSWVGAVPPYTGTDSVTRFLLAVPSAGEADGTRIARVYTTGSARLLTLVYHTGGALEMVGYDVTGAQIFTTGNIGFNVNGALLWVSMEMRQAGSKIDYAIVTLAPGASVGLSYSGNYTGNVGVTKQIAINPSGGTSLVNTAIGHISFQGTWESMFDQANALNAYQGETAGNRFARLCDEEGVPVRIYGPPSKSLTMGPQGEATLYSLLSECEQADGGMMFEPNDIVGLGYRTSNSLCSQTPAAQLDYSLDHLVGPLTPTDDDQHTQNDITVARVGGSSARVVLNDGSPMSVSAPPAGVGSYSASLSVNCYLDSQLPDVAGWWLHLGTVDEERYPSVVADLTYRGMASLFYPVMETKLGDVVTVQNLPTFLPRDGIQAIVWGQTEVLGDFVCNVTAQTQPASPYNVLVAGPAPTTDTYTQYYQQYYGSGDPYADARADTSGAFLNQASIGSADTSFLVGTVLGNALWTTNASDFPFDIIMGGERMTVTNITGSSTPQTFTVTRSVNGVVKPHVEGESVSLFSPVYWALA